jgi:predicted cobalt transporter CbtA
VGWVVLLSWLPAGDPEAMTDRFRILAGAAALVVLPWVGRRQELFGPATRSLTARVVRVAGCALVCGLGLALLRVDRHHTINEVLGNGHINWLREAGGLAALGALVTGGLALTFLFSVIFGELMVLGPLVGGAFGAFGAVYPPRGRPGRSLMAGLFVSRS